MIIREERCKGCGICISACPQDAITFVERTNAQGYPVTEVDLEKCIECGICYTVCPDSVYEIE